MNEKSKILMEEKRKIEKIKTKLNNIKEMKELINKLKINKIKELKLKFPILLKSDEKLISLIFISSDQNINYSIICKNTDNFSKIKSLFYDKYPEYKNLNNSFILKGNIIDINKNLQYYNIQDSDIITLKINE